MSLLSTRSSLALTPRKRAKGLALQPVVGEQATGDKVALAPPELGEALPIEGDPKESQSHG